MIYLTSPYWHTDPAIRNHRFCAACRATADLIREGFTVFSPVVYGHALTPYGLPGGGSFWEPHDSEHLAHCEEVVVLRLDGWRESEGVQAELDAAVAIGKPVRYTDRWKAWEHDRWMTAPGKSGCLTIFGEASDRPDRLSADEKAHHSYARHICNEVEVEEPYQDTIRRRWKAKSENTHWLDASYYSDVAANMKGIRLAGPVVSKPTQTIPGVAAAALGGGRPRMSLGQLVTAARGQ